MGWPHARRIVASGLEGGRGERQGAADSRPDESTPALAEQVAGPSVTMHHCRTIKTQNTIQTTQTPERFNPTQTACCCSRLVALALDEEGLHLPVLQDLHSRPLGSVALRYREELLVVSAHAACLRVPVESTLPSSMPKLYRAVATRATRGQILLRII
jgi:hypothetical protein